VGYSRAVSRRTAEGKLVVEGRSLTREEAVDLFLSLRPLDEPE